MLESPTKNIPAEAGKKAEKKKPRYWEVEIPTENNKNFLSFKLHKDGSVTVKRADSEEEMMRITAGLPKSMPREELQEIVRSYYARGGEPIPLYETFKPRPIPGGKIIAKTRTENIGYEPGPKGGTSFGSRRENTWERDMVVLWDDGKIEEFSQIWDRTSEPEKCKKGKGVRLFPDELVEAFKVGDFYPFEMPVERKIPHWGQSSKPHIRPG